MTKLARPIQHLAFIMLTGTLSLACATQYRFVSQPHEASVYYVNGSQKFLIGQTPIDFAKTALPTDNPFIIIFEKPGFEKKEVSVTPSDNTLTTVNAQLKPSLDANSDEALKKTRGVVQQIFSIQEMIAQKRYVDALATLKKLEESEPNLAETFVIRGSVYVLLNDKAKAKKEWERALKLDPTMEALNVRLLSLSKDLSEGPRP